MGSYSKRLYGAADKPGHVEFKKNVNKLGDSDYDDEDDSMAEPIEGTVSQEDGSVGASARPTIPKVGNLKDDASKMFDDLQRSPRDAGEERSSLIQRDKIDTKKVFDMDDSVAQIDKLSSVASAKPFDRPGDDSSMKGSAGETK